MLSPSKRIIESHWPLMTILLALLMPSGVLSEDRPDRRDLAVEKIQSGALWMGVGASGL
jgi:hypothetical protein